MLYGKFTVLLIFLLHRNAARRKSTLRRAAHSYHSTEKGHLSFHQDSFIKELGEVKQLRFKLKDMCRVTSYDEKYMKLKIILGKNCDEKK